MRIAVLTGGGDCPGLNGAIKWVTKSALDPLLEKKRRVRFDVLGIRNGWKGLVELEPGHPESLARHTVKLNEEIVRTWDRYGGTNLGTSRTNPFNPRKDASARVLENIKALGIDVIVAVGGEDTLGVLSKLHRLGVRTVGIPKTIDGDLVGTDYSLGFDSAVNIIMEEIDRLRTTAGSHNRIFVVETMGRHAGWLALYGGECSGAYIILIPEYPFAVEKVCALLEERRGREGQYSIIVASEGAATTARKEFVKNAKVDEFGHRSLGGIASYIAGEIEEHTGWETRYVILSHLQRGGSPSARDRLMARRFGIAAVDMIVGEDFGRMVSLRQGEITSVPLKSVTERLNLIDLSKHYDTERYNAKRSFL